MKSFKLYLSTLLLLLTLGAVSCNDDFDEPPTNVPVATIKANTTISQLKTEYWKDGNSYIEPIAAGKIIQGRVISSDAAGNIYKQLYIQDETGAICISVDANSLYTTYRVGQQVVINLDNFYIGKYAGLMQLGIPNPTTPTEAGRMSLAMFQSGAQLNGLPNLADIDTTIMTIPELPTVPAEISAKQSRLVRFNDVHWQEAGQTYCTADASSSSGYANTSRTLVDDNGNTIIVRNSGYANFKAELLPQGVGSVVGILSYYNTGSNGAWQILLNSTDDCIGFAPASTEGTEGDPYTVEKALTLMDQSKTGWVSGYIVGAVQPGITEVTNNSNIQWEAPTVLANTIVLAPTADTKDIAKCIIIALPDGSDLRSAANLKDNANAYKKVLKVKGVLKKYMGQGGITTSGASSDFDLEGMAKGATSLSQTFNSASLPSDWGNVQVQGTKAWYAASFNNQYYASMTGYKGTAPFESYLVSPALNIANAAKKSFSFKNQVNGYNSTTSTMKAYVMDSPDPKTATKTEITGINWAIAPESGYSGWVESGTIDLSKYASMGTIYIAFCYSATTDANTNYATWCISDFIFGDATGGNPDPDPDPNPSGLGSETTPYSVAQVITKATTTAIPDVWVEGYIVGFVNGAVFADGAIFSATAPTGVTVSLSNILLAPTAGTNVAAQCIPVQLVYNTTPRNDLNLQANPTNIGKKVKIKGTLQGYFNVPGLKTATDYKFVD